MSIVLFWVFAMWAGWVFIFATDEQALVNSRGQSPADWSGRIYFVAFTMFTMGNGDITPRGDIWQIMTAFTNGSGMLLVTLAVTYLLSVVSAAVQKRSFASQILGLGTTPEAFLRNCWNGSDFRDLDLLLNTLSSKLAIISEQYRAYPVLQYYHAAESQKSAPLAVAVLDEALTILRYGIPEQHQPNSVITKGAVSAVGTLLSTLPAAFVVIAENRPPPPDLERLRARGIPVVTQDEFVKRVQGMGDRRKKLLGLVRNDGWNWMDSAA